MLMERPNTFYGFMMRLISASSQWLNVVFLLGHPNESISGRSHRMGWASEKWIDRLFFWQDNHCQRAYLNDLQWAKDYIKMDAERSAQNSQD